MEEWEGEDVERVGRGERGLRGTVMKINVFLSIITF